MASPAASCGYLSLYYGRVTRVPPLLPTATYSKIPLSTTDLLNGMISRRLIVPDRSKAEHYIKRIGYYRLSGYTLLYEAPVIPGSSRTHIFNTGTTFDMVLEAYLLDRELRIAILDAVERIEVAFRTSIDDIMSITTRDSHWYLDVNNLIYSNYFKYVDLIKIVKRDAAKDKNVFCLHYYENYAYPILPPGWMVTETLSMGTWSKIYAAIKDTSKAISIASEFNLSQTEMISWFRSFSYTRNLCAHHSRLLSIVPTISPKKSYKIANQGISYTRSFYQILACMYFILKQIAPGTSWPQTLKQIFNRHPSVDTSSHLGFPVGWESLPFWK